MESFVFTRRRSCFCVLVALLGAGLAGCATTRPPPYLVSPGAIGVAVVAPPTAELATEANLAGRGFAGGLFAPMPMAYAGPVGMAAGILVAPFTALYGAARGAACEQELQAAYPGLQEKYAPILQREFAPEDVRDQFAAVLREQTAVSVGALDVPPSAEPDREQQLLATASQLPLGHLFLVKIQDIEMGSNIGAKECDSWTLTVHMKTELWSVAERKLVVYPYPKHPYLIGRFSELKALLDEPGALRARLAAEYRVAATSMLDARRFELPP